MSCGDCYCMDHFNVVCPKHDIRVCRYCHQKEHTAECPESRIARALELCRIYDGIPEIDAIRAALEGDE